MKGNKRLKSLRKSKKMTQQELADASGVSVQAIQKIETSKRKIGTTTAEMVANVFHINPAYLTYWIDDPKIRKPIKKIFLKYLEINDDFLIDVNIYKRDEKHHGFVYKYLSDQDVINFRKLSHPNIDWGKAIIFPVEDDK